MYDEIFFATFIEKAYINKNKEKQL